MKAGEAGPRNIATLAGGLRCQTGELRSKSPRRGRLHPLRSDVSVQVKVDNTEWRIQVTAKILLEMWPCRRPQNVHLYIELAFFDGI